MRRQQPTTDAQTSDELLGVLAHQFSLLVRSDLELAAAHHGPALRRVGVEVAAGLAAAAALLLALAALSWSAIQGLALAMPSWAASLLVAAAWGAAAGLLLRLDHPRRLLRRLTDEGVGAAVESAERHRNDAQRAVTVTAERLGEAVAREAAERELKAGLTAAEHLAETAEHEAEDLVKQLIVALLTPGRVGVSLLERIAGRRPAS
jgi:hypothetical protein